MPPKSDRSRRTIALPAQLVDELREHQAVQAAERDHAGPLWDEHGLVFAQATGRPVDPRRDWTDWKALLARAEVPDARAHDARHTAATLLLAQGVPERVVQEILGHSTIKMTQHYTHVLPEVAREAAARMGRVLWE